MSWQFVYFIANDDVKIAYCCFLYLLVFLSEQDSSGECISNFGALFFLTWQVVGFLLLLFFIFYFLCLLVLSNICTCQFIFFVSKKLNVMCLMYKAVLLVHFLNKTMNSERKNIINNNQNEVHRWRMNPSDIHKIAYTFLIFTLYFFLSLPGG